MRRYFSRRRGHSADQGRRSTNQLRTVAFAAQHACQPLESRVLLSTIVWANRVTSDNFGTIYGANATLARGIVDRAIGDWERVINNFNYSGGGNTYSVNVTANPISGRGSTSITGILGGKPTSASITLDDNGQGGGWYFDPTIGTSTLPDDGEFSTFNNRFESDNAVTDNDFYRTIAHELGHAMGIANGGTLSMNSFITNVGADPNAAGASVFSFNAGFGVIASFTNDGGLHTYEGPSVAGVPVLPHDLLNSGRTVALNLNRRQLISDIDATILQQAYGYTITLPSQINSFYANLNTSTGALTILGDPGVANDSISLNNSGGQLQVQVNGTSEVFPAGSVTSINLVAGDGNDTINVNFIPAGATVSIDAGAGDDSIRVGGGDFDTNLESNFTVTGGAGTDSLTVIDTADGSGGDDYTITSTSLTKNASVIDRIMTYGTVESLTINGSPFGSTYDINSLSSALGNGLTINAGAANDTITLGGTVGDVDSFIFANVVMNGSVGTDTIHINDANDDPSVDDSYTLGSSSFSKSSSARSFTYSGMENVVLDAGLANNAIGIQDFLPSENVTVRGNAGNDTITNVFHDLNTNWEGNLTIDGGADADTIALDDSGDLTAAAYTLGASSFGVTGGITTNLFPYTGIETFTWLTNTVNTDINITGTNAATSYTVSGNSGNDTFNLGVAGGNAEAINGALTINGDAGTDAWNYLDSTNVFPNTYTLTSTTITRTANAVVTFATMENATLLIGTGSLGTGEIVNAAGFSNIGTGLQSLVITGNTGNDQFNLGSGDLENDFAFVPVTVNGGGGTDSMYLNDLTDAEGNDAYTFTANTFDKNTAGLSLITFGGMTSVKLDANPFNNTININGIASGVALTVNGNAGNDTVNVGAGDMDSNFFGGTLTIDGGAGGADSVVFDDSNDGPGVDSYLIEATTLDKPNFAAPIAYANFESQRLEASPNDDSIVMESSFPDWRINGNAGADTINVIGNQVGSVVTVDGGIGLDTVSVNSDSSGVGAIQFLNNQDLASLSVFAGGTATMTAGGNKMLYTQALSVTGTGKLDLTNNAAVVDYTGASPVGVVAAALTLGYAGGTWGGNGITSSTAAADASRKTALGYAEATDLFSAFPNTFRGQSIDSTAVLINYTLYGDADLSRHVDLTDFTLLAANFNFAGQRWSRGNFDYDAAGQVNLTDFTLLASNFNSTAPAPAMSPAISVASRIIDDAGGAA